MAYGQYIAFEERLMKMSCFVADLEFVSDQCQYLGDLIGYKI